MPSTRKSHPTVAEVEALRDVAERVINAERGGSARGIERLVQFKSSFTPELAISLCDYWLAAHRSTPATPPSTGQSTTAPGPSGAGGSAGDPCNHSVEASVALARQQ